MKDLARTYEGQGRSRRVLQIFGRLDQENKEVQQPRQEQQAHGQDTKETMRVVRKFARKNERAMRSFKKEMQRIDRKDRGLVNKRAFKDECTSLAWT